MDQGQQSVATAADAKRAKARRLSRELFGGAAYRLEVGAAVARLGVVNTSELAEELAISKQSANKELLTLTKVGLLTRDGRGPLAGRFVSYRRNDSAYFDFCANAFENAAAMLSLSEDA